MTFEITNSQVKEAARRYNAGYDDCLAAIDDPDAAVVVSVSCDARKGRRFRLSATLGVHVPGFGLVAAADPETAVWKRRFSTERAEKVACRFAQRVFGRRFPVRVSKVSY